MSLAINDIKIIVRKCFNLPAEIPTKCEGLIGSFMRETEYAAGHRKAMPTFGYATRFGPESDRAIEIKDAVIKFLSTLKIEDSATMRQVHLNSTACLTTTKVIVKELLKLELIKRVRLVYKGKSLYYYSLSKGIE